MTAILTLDFEEEELWVGWKEPRKLGFSSNMDSGDWMAENMAGH